MYLTDRLYDSLDKRRDLRRFAYCQMLRENKWNGELLTKCEKEFGLPYSLLKWLRSYLTDRRQESVDINNSTGQQQHSILSHLDKKTDVPVDIWKTTYSY